MTHTVLSARRARLRTGRSGRGFTLVELLVAMALMTIISTILATFLMNAQRMYDVSVAQSSVISNARVALDVIGRDLDNITPLDAQIPTAFENRGAQNKRVMMGESDPTPIGRPVALTLRSPGFEPSVNNWNTSSERARFVSWSGGNPAQAEIDDKTFLSFYATTTTVVAGQNGGPDRIGRRPVFIQYYLLARPDPINNEPSLPGAFLVRRVHAYQWSNTNGNWTCQWESFVEPVNEDICSYVRGVVVRYKDRTITPGVGNKDLTMIEATSTPLVGDPPPAAGFRPVWDSGINAVRFVLDPDWWEFNLSRDFVQKDFLPPCIEVSLLLNDDRGFTTREVKRLYNFPTAPLVVPPKPR
ncbi:MAG: type II secretion system protein J [Planctomycetota bacterium]